MKRIVAITLALAIMPQATAQTETSSASSKRGCWGVAIELRDGPAALLAMRATGDKEAIERLVEEAKAMGLHGEPKQANNGQWEVFIPFSSPPITGAKARGLVERAHAGAFGTMKVMPEIMDISVLPRGKCPDAYL